MSREAFEEWWQANKWGEMTLTGIGLKLATLDAWEARQPEIDALKYDNLIQREACRALGRLASELKDEKAALKAEVERSLEAVRTENAACDMLRRNNDKLHAEVERLRKDAGQCNSIKAVAIPEMYMPTRMHSLDRTSPKGEKFVGRCNQCGKEGLTISDMHDGECANPLGITQGEALLEAMKEPK